MASDNDIRTLLDRYFDGETTAEQERTLKRYFAGKDIPSDLQYARSLFGALSAAAEERCPLGAADLVPAANRGTRAAKRLRGRIVRLASLCAATAAAVVLLCTLFLTDRNSRPEIYCYLNGQPVTDMDIALRQADMAERIWAAGIRSTVDGMHAARTAGLPLNTLRKTSGTVPQPDGTDTVPDRAPR